MIWKQIAALLTALVVISATAGAARQQATSPSPKTACATRTELDLSVTQASVGLEQKEYASVIETLKPVSRLGCDPRIDLLLAAAYEENKNLAEAEQTLQHAHLVWPGDTSIATSLAREYMTQGDQARAAKALDHFHASSATPWQEIQLSVVVFLSDQQLSNAEGLAQLGYKVYPSIDSLLLLANTLQLEGRYKDVIALLDSKRASYASLAKFLVTLAESEYDASIYDTARSDVERAITLDPTLYQAHYLLGNILLKQGDAEAATTEYRAALQLAPDQPRTYYHLALALRATHTEAEEESLLSKAIELDSHYALAHCEMGRILLNQSRIPEAVAQLELAVKENTSSEEAYSLLARAYEKAGNKEKAEATAKRLADVRKANHQSRPVATGKAAGEITP